MPKQPTPTDTDDNLDPDEADMITAGFEHMVTIALDAAMITLKRPLTADEAEGIIEHCRWYAVAAAYGCHPLHLAEAMHAEAQGTQTFH